MKTRFLAPCFAVLVGPVALVALSASVAVAAPPGPPGYVPVDRVAAVVDDEVLTEYEVNRQFMPLAGLGHSILDEGEREKWFVEKRKDTLDEMVNTVLVLAEGRKLGIEVSPQQVAGHLQQIKKENSWSDEDLDGFVRQLGFAGLSAYREHVEKEMLKAQMISVKIGSRAAPSKDDVERVFLRDYHGGKAQDEIRAEHILLKVPNLTTPDQLREVRRKIESLRTDAVNGTKSFDDLARDHSEDLSAKDGGDLGWFSRGIMDPAFERVAFGLATGKVSDVFQTQFGFHVVRVVARREAPIDNPARVKRLIQMELELDNRVQGYEAWVKELRLTHAVELKL